MPPDPAHVSASCLNTELLVKMGAQLGSKGTADILAPNGAYDSDREKRLVEGSDVISLPIPITEATPFGSMLQALPPPICGVHLPSYPEA